MTKGRFIKLCSGVYLAICLAQPIGEMFFDLRTFGKLTSMWAATSAISDPVFRTIGLLIFVGLTIALIPGIVAAWIAVLALGLGILIVFYFGKTALWLAGLSPGGALVVALAMIAILGAVVYAKWERLIEAAAQFILSIRWLFALDRGGFYYSPARITSRIGGVLVAVGCGILLFGAYRRTPVWFSQISRMTTPAPIREQIILAPVGRWSETLQTPDSTRYFPKIVVDGDVFVKDDVGRVYKYGPGSGVYMNYPKSLRWASRTRNPVRIHVFSTAPIVTSAEATRPNTFVVVAPIGKWSELLDVGVGTYSWHTTGRILVKINELKLYEDSPTTQLNLRPIETVRFTSQSDKPVEVYVKGFVHHVVDGPP